MKKQKLIFLQILLLLISGLSNAQTTGTLQTITPNGMFDRVFDQYGNQYPLINLSLTAARPLSGGTYSTSNVPTNSCSAGYFNLYFAPNSLFDLNSSAANVICEVYRNISGFISSSLSYAPGTGQKINIYCDNIGASIPTSVLGLGGLLYTYPYNAANPNPGIIDSQVQKALLSGLNPFANLPISVFGGANSFYAGYMYVNPSPSSATWNYNLTTTSIGSGSVDLYSILLHEAMHTIGFASLIGGNGVSLLGSSNNYFSRYDQYLTNSSGTPLIAGTSTACSTSSLTFQGPTSAINPSNCAGGGSDLTNCAVAVRYISPTISSTVNLKVYTPNCFENGSSLSHFEDMCSYGSFTTTCVPTPTAPGYNNLYFVMSNATSNGNCYVKRHLTAEERHVLCDLGYSVNTTYTSTAAGASYTYAGGACNGSNVWGMHDGFSGGAFTYTTNTSTFSIPTSSLLLNDSPTATQVSCPEVVYGFGAVSIASGSLTVTSIAGSGLMVVKYLPKAGSQIGTSTYVYIYFMQANCGANACNMVQNGSLESIVTNTLADLCGPMFPNSISSPILSCWTPGGGSPDLYTRNCSSTVPQCNLGINTWASSPAINSHNGTPNDRIVGIAGGEYMENNLSAPLIPGLAYQFSIWLLNPVNTTYNPANNPLVLTVAANTNVATLYNISTFPAGLPILAQYTLNPNVWTQFTNTFVFAPGTSTLNHNAIIIGINASATYDVIVNTATIFPYVFFDDLSLNPLASPNPAFSIPQAANCGNASFTNLAQYANYPGTFSGTGVTSTTSGTVTTYNFNSPTPSLSPGTYPIAFTYTDSNSGCIYNLSQNVILGSPNFTVTTYGNPVYCANYSPPQAPMTLSASCTQTSGITYVWQPGNISGATATTIPLASQVYSLFALGNCLTTTTLAVQVSTACCVSTISPIPSILAIDDFESGPLLINGNITVQGGQSLYFTGGQFLFAPNVQITVNNGGTMYIDNSHLYACTTMWKGIKVMDGGAVFLSTQSPTYDNLIEDAITAIDISNQTANSLTAILAASKTTFNKNYVDINIADYERSSSSYPFVINNCVFTCRNFSFTSTTWPQTSGSSPGLRFAATTTTALAPPYALLSATITNLKSPYSSQPSKTAIQLSNVGITGSTSFYGAVIGNTTSASNFNLFDAHGEFINALNSNVSSYNNVFQNTQRYILPIPFPSSGYYYTGGAAITCKVNTVMNTNLDLSAANVNVSNRFWNCHTGVAANNVFNMNIDHAIFRSTQSNTLLPGGGTLPGFMTPGEYGVSLYTNRFNCNISNSEFTNLNTGVTANISTSTFTMGSSTVQNGTYAQKLAITQNTFSPLPVSGSTVIGNNYVNQAVGIYASNTSPWSVAPDHSNPSSIGIVVENNLLTRVYDGIAVNGIYGGFRSSVANNTLTLEDDNTFSLPQHGISALNTGGKNVIAGNMLSGAGTGTANTLATLVHCGINSGLFSPSVTCNDLGNSYQGFEFYGNNLISTWAGNRMSNLARGLVLSSTGIMGAQGSNATSLNNQWNGSWNVLTGNFSTFVYSGSNATQSGLWIKSGVTTPTANGGSAGGPQQYGAPGTTSTSSGGDYNCTGAPNSISVPLPNAGNYDSNEKYYIANTAMYRFLMINDSVRSGGPYTSFCAGLAGSSVDIFWEIEQSLYNGDHATAASLNSGITPTNTVEQNYQHFYDIFAHYVGNGYLSGSDSSALFTLTQLCPGTDGACVYQARALYTSACQYTQRYPNTCDSRYARMAQPKSPTLKNSWILDFYPNPANNQITIVTNQEDDILRIEIKDLSGRNILSQDIKTQNFIANLDLSLLNGAYLITITNSNHESVTKKLLIAK